MWIDKETEIDFLNFDVLAKTTAGMIISRPNEPISIGVSGDWGVGKSSLVKMIGQEINTLEKKEKYLTIEFNAWLYQGYEDARVALLQKITEALTLQVEDTEGNIKKFKKKVFNFFKRVNIGQTAKLGATFWLTALSALQNSPEILAMGAILNSIKDSKVEDIKDKLDQYNSLEPELKKLFKSNVKEEVSLPQEIDDLRKNFEELLEKNSLHLIVLVDDLDRCLPDTAISTLEAMRLLLFVPRMVFVIAADNNMIKNAVQKHFGFTDNERLVTSYFDKLIQVPIHVPRAGINEVKSYMLLLFAELAERDEKITKEIKNGAYEIIKQKIKRPWEGELTRGDMIEAFQKKQCMTEYIDIVEQVAYTMISENIQSNPRLIKRFLNNLLIRQSIAKAQEMNVDFQELAKMLLLERCAIPSVFNVFLEEISKSEDGKLAFLDDLEEGREGEIPVKLKNDTFIKNWAKLTPKLSDVDLRPFLYLSNTQPELLSPFKELSEKGKDVLDALKVFKTTKLDNALIESIKVLRHEDVEIIFSTLKKEVEKQNWDNKAVVRMLHIIDAFPDGYYKSFLNDIPSKNRRPAIAGILVEKPYAIDIIGTWLEDKDTPINTKKAIKGVT